ncbi:unnamed protein product [Cuscuta epithymum]|uniref:Uncharacterized protein n=1 Tax=Cuscuta epithymum TaxID=186058 RepID=A0AAV0G6T4_9ASTE|nr:unnamed protein product [Cuscuta epithymum]CAH9143653.1 unnamed protein product [Cuscuta epithymum]
MEDEDFNKPCFVVRPHDGTTNCFVPSSHIHARFSWKDQISTITLPADLLSESQESQRRFVRNSRDLRKWQIDDDVMNAVADKLIDKMRCYELQCNLLVDIIPPAEDDPEARAAAAVASKKLLRKFSMLMLLDVIIIAISGVFLLFWKREI